jgi:hypothetical protein
MLGATLKIQYTGASASCLLTASATAKTLSSAIGAAGAEVADAAFGVAGTITLTGATVDTIEELAAVIEAYTSYTASVVYGEGVASENILDAVMQAKTAAAYVAFDLPSVLGSYSLTTWARIKYMLGLEEDDRIAAEYIANGVTGSAEVIAKRKIKARSYGPGLCTPHDFDGSGRDRMKLPGYPINSISHIYIDSLRAFGSSTEVDSDDIVIYADEGIVALDGSYFTAGMRNVRFEYNGGLAIVPDYIQNAVVECVTWNLKRFRGGNIGMRSIAGDGVSTTFEIDIPLSARKAFESLRDWIL